MLFKKKKKQKSITRSPRKTNIERETQMNRCLFLFTQFRAEKTLPRWHEKVEAK